MEGKGTPGATLCLLSIKQTPPAAPPTGETLDHPLKVSNIQHQQVHHEDTKKHCADTQLLQGAQRSKVRVQSWLKFGLLYEMSSFHKGAGFRFAINATVMKVIVFGFC